MIGITNPPGRFILQVAHDVVFVDLLWCADSVVTGGAGMPDADEVQGSARVSPIEKKPIRFRYRSVLRRSPNVRAYYSEKYCLFLLDSLQNRYPRPFNDEDFVFCIQRARGRFGDGRGFATAQERGGEACLQRGRHCHERLRAGAGVEAQLVAAEPLLANPVAFDIDEQGRFYVVESFRLHKGVMDIRGHMNWLDEELASQSTEDMRAMFRRYKVPGLTDYSDRVRQLVDRDGDGVMDHATVFADGFNDEVDGLAAGVLARNGKVWFTNIPHLWLLEDKNGDGKADTKQSLASGFGVRVGFLGHDLHGLRQGPDGRIYFSIGDRAASVTTKDGRKLHTPEYGTIYRCEPDGSDLELYHIGLRNPQELAFDAHGNLFTGDNNSDGGDPARWVNAVEGGDSGWRIGWQFLEGAPWTTRRGPWLDERMCFPDGKAAHRIPPVANIGNGPSGLTYYPGVGLGDQYANMFFMCDFKGSPARSGVHTIRNTPVGAHFKVEQTGRLVWKTLVTDVEFGFDGHAYISDWVNGWAMTGKGRILSYR